MTSGDGWSPPGARQYNHPPLLRHSLVESSQNSTYCCKNFPEMSETLEKCWCSGRENYSVERVVVYQSVLTLIAQFTLFSSTLITLHCLPPVINKQTSLQLQVNSIEASLLPSCSSVCHFDGCCVGVVVGGDGIVVVDVAGGGGGGVDGCMRC